MKLNKGWGLLLLTVVLAAFAAEMLPKMLTKQGVDPVSPVTSVVSHQESVPEGPLPDLSVYNLEGLWKDQRDEDLSLLSLRGRPQVVALIYGGCQGACPRIIGDIKSVEETVKKTHPKGVGYLLVTMDPEVDSIDRLQALAQEYDLGPDWRLLRGTPDQVRELAAVLGVKYRKVSETDFAHSNTVSILDAQGTLVYQKQELGADIHASAAAIEGLLDKPDACCGTP